MAMFFIYLKGDFKMEDIKKEIDATLEEDDQTETNTKLDPERFTVFKYKLTKPLDYEGKKYDELTLDFGRLTGHDALSIEEEMEKQNIYIVSPETSRAYQIRVAARAGGFPHQLSDKMSLRDFNRLANAARNFLIGQEL